MSWKTRLATVAIITLAIFAELAPALKINPINLANTNHSKAAAMTPPNNQSDVDARLVAANTKFGFNLFNTLTKQQPNKNIFISPTSVALALSMTYNGVSGETKQEMTKVLQLTGMTPQEINAANQGLQNSFQKVDPNVQVLIANSLWAQQGFSLKPEFLQTNQEYYNANLTELDFINPQALSIINNWVSQKTQGKINKIVDKINPDGVLFLINAIYFKGKWQTPFDKSQTANKTFSLTDGSSKQHPMMSQKGIYGYYETDTFQAVSLPYGKEGALAMYIFLPNSNSNLATFLQQQLTPENWNQWMQEFTYVNGTIEIPRFKIEYEVELENTLTALGMAEIFDSSKGNFSVMTNKKVAVDSVKHKTFVEVNEEGTEAAAVTSTGLTRSGSPFEMNVNRPFFCVIQDHTTGTILFMGLIVDPQ
ncbi:serpin family protein [Microcoleus sp. OTE_8_concoct_300]|uniref:serpin family protein n=1 Tax=Microcoleus sp. OTE_8_concoct_300 TaxID=2964710 RepID=UPI00403F35D5